MRRHAPLLALLLAAAPVLALEISLEENKANRGNIGYVDLQKIFKLFPGTKKAKESFAALVKESEDNLSLRKGELSALRAEIARLTAERETLLAAPPAAAAPPVEPVKASTQAAPAAVVPPPPAPPAPKPAEIAVSSASPVLEAAPKDIIDSLPGFTKKPAVDASTPSVVETSTPAATTEALPEIPAVIPPEDTSRRRAQEPLILQLPGEATGFLEPVAAPPEPAKAPEPLPAPAPAVVEVSTPAAIAAPAVAASVTDRIRELDALIEAKKAELARKEAEFKEHQSQIEKNLIDIESRRSEILLGKIYAAVREVARDSGVSVVVDKSQILFGQNAVDLTAKVAKKLEESPQ